MLDIVRPDGLRRSYKTEHEFQRKGEAKMKAASLAIGLGALEFILWGEDAKGRGGQYALALVNTPPKAPQAPLPVPTFNGHPLNVPNSSIDESKTDIGTIERCCQEWRAGRIMPYWVYTADPKTGRKFDSF